MIEFVNKLPYEFAEVDVLIDTDALIGLTVEKDNHFNTASAVFDRLLTEEKFVATTTYVVAETASTLSYKFSQDYAKDFLNWVNDILIITISSNIHRKTNELFLKQPDDRTSFVDMSNVVVMKEFQIPQIFAFDKVYSDDFNLHTITNNNTHT